jgi:predicted ATP-grasp superfamily ATP-dependent carboligase
VFAANTHAGLLPELRERGAELLDEGEISGLNGSFLAAAAARGLEGVCLLGEFPFYASGIANPKASSAVLACFTGLAGVALHRAELDAVAARIETLFAEAARDRDRALALKAELDRHGLFMRFEDRFLDLFRQGS